MKYELKGNYFDGRFNPPCTTGPGAVEHFIKRECPSDINQYLWEMSIDYSHLEPTVDSAASGFQFWRGLKLEEKIKYLKKYQEQVLAKKEQIAEAIALESGKPLWEAQGEVNSVIGKVDICINNSYGRIKHQEIEEIMPNTKGHVYFKPLGIALIIGPFNFPCHLANTQILSSLISGNSVIFKPSEKTAYSAQCLIECFHEAGFPKGVINLIQGGGEIGNRLLSYKKIKSVQFTGSKEVGLNILKNTYSDLSKLVALELGGKNPAIIHKDANLDNAMEEMIRGCYLTTGQRCTSTSIVLIHRSIMNEFIDKFHKISKRVIIDHPINHEKEPFMGPLIDKQSLNTYLLYMGMAKREGIEEIMRGKQLTKKTEGYYVSPSIHLADNWNDKSHFLTNEIFGPNCTFIPYDDLEQAIAVANANEYGLAASIFTKDKSIYEKCVHEIETGLLNLNRGTCGASPKLPFGGVKNSGNHRPMAVASIDSCVMQMSSLELYSDEAKGLETIKGLES